MAELLSQVTDSAASAAPARSSSRWRQRKPAAALGCAALAVIVIVAGAAAGLWFLPFVAGLVIGLATRHLRLRVVLPSAAAVAVAGWAIPLLWQAAHGEPVGATARVVAALAGLPASAALLLGVTVLIPVIQALVGLWLARAIRRPATG